jgi:hypothetical protein
VVGVDAAVVLALVRGEELGPLRLAPMTETNDLRYLQLDCFRNEFPDFFFSRREEARINGSRILEIEFDLGEVEGFEDIPGRPSTGD